MLDNEIEQPARHIISETISEVSIPETEVVLRAIMTQAANRQTDAKSATHRAGRKGSPEVSSTDALSCYLHEIGKFELLTKPQEVELAKAIENGHAAIQTLQTSNTYLFEDTPVEELQKTISQGHEAKTLFMQSNLRLTVSIAKRYPLPTGMDLLDLIQDGNIGLARAVDKFDWRKGFKFSTYATFWIKQAIGRTIDKKGNLLYIPAEKSAELRQAMREYEADNDGGKTEKLAPHLEQLRTASNPVSLNTKVDDKTIELGELISSSDISTEEKVLQNTDLADIRSLLTILPPRERIAIDMRYGFNDGVPRPYKQIGQIFGMTAEGARRIIVKAENTLREEAIAKGIRR